MFGLINIVVGICSVYIAETWCQNNKFLYYLNLLLGLLNFIVGSMSIVNYILK